MSNEAPTESVSDLSKPLVLDEVIKPLLENRRAFHAFLTRRLGDAAFAEDLLQQCFIKALAHIHSIQQLDRIVSWFYQILRHALIDYYRAKEPMPNGFRHF